MAASQNALLARWENMWAAEEPCVVEVVDGPDGSIVAFRHEFQHYKDIRDAGFPGLRPYMSDPKKFYEMEFRGYMEEIRFARSQRDLESAGAILQQLREERECFESIGMVL